jgi:hypothetical protein
MGGQEPKSPLLAAYHRVSQPGQRVPGTRDSQQVVPNRIVLMPPLDRESLLATFQVIGQRSVGETEPINSTCAATARFINRIHDATRIERPEERCAKHDRYHDALREWLVRPVQLSHFARKHVPVFDCATGELKHLLALAEADRLSIDVVADGRFASG